MYVAEKIREPAQINAVALKAYARVADAWGLSLKEAAGLADMSESTWKRAKKPINAVALKAYARVADAWGLSLKEAAGLADMSEST
ncbi:antitoxin Xre-like helix-turn-helix domain-containing protein [Thioclava dalianensis]|uniref:antitoxin Xre-like helix-turn-helix domain-containing protein n=1 Tax=Thioclava dalianensis TaxID=1185766 RepID=UPI000B1164E5